MPDALGAVEWHARWSPEHPVHGKESAGRALFLSVEDAVHRIRTAFPPDETKPPAERVWAALHSGRSVLGFVWHKEDPNGAH